MARNMLKLLSTIGDYIYHLTPRTALGRVYIAIADYNGISSSF